jgi:hypothetical protein
MRKILAIPVITLILFTGIKVNFATHWCGGSVAATKVSLSGELATCGMEHQGDKRSEADLYKNLCCDDVLKTYSFSCNYIPSYSIENHIFRQVDFIADVAVVLKPGDMIPNTCSDETIRPPGTYEPSSVDLQVLCISRI